MTPLRKPTPTCCSVRCAAWCARTSPSTTARRPLAADLRALVRQQVAAGRPDADIRAFLVKRYGEFVLLKPAFSPANALLWLTPFVIVLGGGGAIALRRRGEGLATPEAPLDPAEEARLAVLSPSRVEAG